MPQLFGGVVYTLLQPEQTALERVQAFASEVNSAVFVLVKSVKIVPFGKSEEEIKRKVTAAEVGKADRKKENANEKGWEKEIHTERNYFYSKSYFCWQGLIKEADLLLCFD